MNTITDVQVREIMNFVDDGEVASYTFKEGHLNDHCFVEMKSGNRYVIRISRKAWAEPDRKVTTFMREYATEELIAKHTHFKTPKTHFIGGSLTVLNGVYAVQDFVPGMVFQQAFQQADKVEKIDLLRLFGATAKVVHSIELPAVQIEGNNAILTCTPLTLRCLPEDVDSLTEDNWGKRIEEGDGTYCIFDKGCLARAVYTAYTADQFLENFEQDLKHLRKEQIVNQSASDRLVDIVSAHHDMLDQTLTRNHLCHGDYHFSNIMVDRDESTAKWYVSGLYDFELAQVTNPIEDFCKGEKFSFPNISIPHFRQYIFDGYGDGLDPFQYAMLMLGFFLKEPFGQKLVGEACKNVALLDEDLGFLGLF